MSLVPQHRSIRRRSALLATTLMSLVMSLAFAGPAGAAETVYWDNYGAAPANIAFATIDGSGGGLLNLGTQPLEGPEGMTYDSLTNRLFVANEAGGEHGTILAINLDGSGAVPFTAPGAPIEEPEGIALDPANRLIFWANSEGGESIVWANLDGSTGGILNTTGATLDEPGYRIAVDPVGGRVYWVNRGASPDSISYANMNNTGGGGDLNLTGSTVEPGGEGLAIDSAGGRIYFIGGGEVGYANLNGSGGGDVNTTGAIINGPYGIGFDPSLGRLYLGNYSNGEERPNAIGFVNIGGGGGGISPLTAPVNGPQDPVVIKSPTGTAPPTISRNAKNRAKLSCTEGAWAGDYPGGFVYQAPRLFGFQWTRNGKSVSGATAATLTAKSAGKYACVVTATNQAGAGAQTSTAVNVKAAKVKLTTKKKAKAEPGDLVSFKVKAVNQGDLKAKNARICVKLPKAAKADLKAPKCKKLGLAGHAKKTTTIKIKVKAGAEGTDKVTFQVKGSGGKSAKAKIIVG